MWEGGGVRGGERNKMGAGLPGFSNSHLVHFFEGQINLERAFFFVGESLKIIGLQMAETKVWFDRMPSSDTDNFLF